MTGPRSSRNIFLHPGTCYTYIPWTGSVEQGILDAVVPTARGTLKWTQAEGIYQLSYDTGEEHLTKTCSTIPLSLAWLVRVEASLKAGNSSKGVVGMKPSNPADEARLQCTELS